LDILKLFEGISTLFTADPLISIGRIVLIALGFLFVFLGFKRTLEPLLMIPMGMGMIAVNAGMMMVSTGQLGTLFLDPTITETHQLVNIVQMDFLQPIYNFTFSNGLIACLVFMGIGAMLDLDYLLAKPYMSMWLAIWAELGTILTLPIAMLVGFSPKEAAAIALVGGADGPMVLFGSIVMAKNIFVPIAIVAYLYLGVCYAGYPYLAKLMIPKRLRAIEMDWRTIPQVSMRKKFTFSVVTCGVLCLLFPVAAPLFASLFVGLAVKEAGVTRYVEFLTGPLLYGSTFFLAFTLGCLMSANLILDPKIFWILILGMIALLLSGVGGLIGGLLYRKMTKEPFNPLLGLAAVSCVPTTAKVVQKVASKANPRCMLIPFAMGPNVAGVITTAIICGIYITSIGYIG
jgi:sodium ion-translocating decarboxylase beta subunit